MIVLASHLLSLFLSLPTLDQADCSPQIVAVYPGYVPQWVQVFNPCDEPIDLSQYVVRHTGANFGFGATVIDELLQPGDCTIAMDFDPPLQPGLACADAVALFNFTDDALTDLPLNGVSYGPETCEEWAGDMPDAPAPLPWEHLELVDGAWKVVDGVVPETCPGDKPEQIIKLPDSVETCIRLDEVFYNPVAPANGRQWIDVRNVCDTMIDLADVTVHWTGRGEGYDFGALPLKGRIAAHGCITVGGPLADASNYNPKLTIATDFAPNLVDPGFNVQAEAIALFHKSGFPFDSVIYGKVNTKNIVNWLAEVGGVDVGRVNLGSSMVRYWYGWTQSDAPKPGKCTDA